MEGFTVTGSGPPQKVPKLLIFGDLGRKEFRLWWENLTEAIRERAVVVENLISWLCTYENRIQNSEEAENECVLTPDFIVILSSYSGEYREGDVQKLRAFFPITPLLAILGNWCEGENRTGTPLSGTHSILWYDFAAKAPLEWTSFENNLATIWSQPDLWLPEQCALFELDREKRFKKVFYRNLARKNPSMKVKFHIDTDDFDQYIMLRDIFLRDEVFGPVAAVSGSWDGENAAENETENENKERTKIETEDETDSRTKFGIEPEPDVKFLLFDFPDLHEATRNHFYVLANRFPNAVWIAFTEAPHPDEWRFLRQCGVRALFPKPFRIMDLRFFCRQFCMNPCPETQRV